MYIFTIDFNRRQIIFWSVLQGGRVIRISIVQRPLYVAPFNILLLMFNRMMGARKKENKKQPN